MLNISLRQTLLSCCIIVGGNRVDILAGDVIVSSQIRIEVVWLLSVKILTNDRASTDEYSFTMRAIVLKKHFCHHFICYTVECFWLFRRLYTFWQVYFISFNCCYIDTQWTDTILRSKKKKKVYYLYNPCNINMVVFFKLLYISWLL